MGKKVEIKKVEIKKEYFDYLDGLRESGRANMYGAIPYLEDEFSLDRTEAKAVLVYWMKSKNYIKEGNNNE